MLLLGASLGLTQFDQRLEGLQDSGGDVLRGDDAPAGFFELAGVAPEANAVVPLSHLAAFRSQFALELLWDVLAPRGGDELLDGLGWHKVITGPAVDPVESQHEVGRRVSSHAMLRGSIRFVTTKTRQKRSAVHIFTRSPGHLPDGVGHFRSGALAAPDGVVGIVFVDLAGPQAKSASAGSIAQSSMSIPTPRPS